MRIVEVASEFAPLAKAGGLGEVVVGLSRELNRLHEQVEIIIPKHDLIAPQYSGKMRLEVPEFKSYEHGRPFSNAMWIGEFEECQVHLLEARHPAGYFHRGKIYGSDDDVPRYLYFCRAVAEYLKLKREPIDILHLHDWHTAPLAILIRDLFEEQIPVKSIVLSIHNIEYQGKCAAPDLDAIGLKGSQYLTPDLLQDNNPNHPQSINLLKGGIVYADSIIAVSPTYAKEIITPFYGFGLDSTLKSHKAKLKGILNGIDDVLWNPNTDFHLPINYDSKSSLNQILAAKQACKESLCKRFNLDSKSGPWVGAVTRLVPQKGPQLIEKGLHHTLQSGGTFALLGSSPIPQMQEHFVQLKTRYKQNKHALLELEYDDGLAHQIYAALDFLLVPSIFEPCGLTQMIGLHYGTLPIVRATGGLKDTIVDCDNALAPCLSRNGFVFKQPTAEALEETLDRAFSLHANDPATFQNLMRRGMQIDFSWKKPARSYLKIFQKLLGKSDPIEDAQSLDRL